MAVRVVQFTTRQKTRAIKLRQELTYIKLLTNLCRQILPPVLFRLTQPFVLQRLLSGPAQFGGNCELWVKQNAGLVRFPPPPGEG